MMPLVPSSPVPPGRRSSRAPYRLPVTRGDYSPAAPVCLFPDSSLALELRILGYQSNCAKEFGQLPYSFFKNQKISIKIPSNLGYCPGGHQTRFGFFLDTRRTLMQPAGNSASAVRNTQTVAGKVNICNYHYISKMSRQL